jgi:protein SCO1/2
MRTRREAPSRLGSRLALGLASVGLIGTLAACGSSNGAYDGLELVKPAVLPDVTFTDTSNKPFNLPADSRGKLSLYYFGYTNCPDVCPATMSDLNTALGKLTADERAKVQVVFVTTDPADDSPTVLRMWLDNFSTSFIGLRTDLKSVQAAAAKVGVVAEDPSTDTEGKVTDTHSAQVIAFSQTDGLGHLVWTQGTTPVQYAHDIKLLLS